VVLLKIEILWHVVTPHRLEIISRRSAFIFRVKQSKLNPEDKGATVLLNYLPSDTA
jgi:hypothetical protein